MKTNFKHYTLIYLLIAGMALTSMVGCSASKTAQGAGIGAGVGAAIGSVLGGRDGEAGKGAAIGGAAGAAIGAIIGRQMDKQAEELEEDLDGAEIVRVEEGIQITFESAILFEFGSSALAESAKANLDELASSMTTYDNTKVKIVGHTDSVGSDGFNQKLSEERAASVASYLASRGISWERLGAEGRGEAQPVATNETDAGRQQNRRVELFIEVTDEYRQELEAQQTGNGN